jgi:pimeloyl-ACP methyl ester carboxylesterase
VGRRHRLHGEIRALQRREFRANEFANPLRGLPGDATYLADFLRRLTGPIVLVGHSYGGAVISNAATGKDQVKALVYFNGWMPDEGESIQQLLEKFEGSLVGRRSGRCRSPTRTGAKARTPFLDPEAFHAAFADVDRAASDVMAATQRPWNGAAIGAPWGRPRKTLLVVPARHGGQGDPAGDAAVHGRAREGDDRRGVGLTRLHGWSSCRPIAAVRRAAGRHSEA